MFDFRIIELADGNQVIDRTLKTPYNSLTGVQMVEYYEVDIKLLRMDRIEKQRKAEERRQRKLARNPLYRFACMCGMI